MFDLEKAIQSWRHSLTADGVFSGETLDELESHLRDEIEQQTRTGMTPEDALQSAIVRIGQSAELGAEFSKLTWTPHPERPKYLAAFSFVSAVLILISASSLVPQFSLNSIGHALGFGVIFCTIGYLIALPFCYRWLPSLERRAVAEALGIGSFFVCFWVLLVFLDSIKLVTIKSDDITIAVLWSIVPAHLATLLAYNAFGFCRIPSKSNHLDFGPVTINTLESARNEAIQLCHDFVGTEHLLLGLLRSEHSLVPQVLNKFGLNEQLIRNEIEKIVGRGVAAPKSKTIPYTPRARTVLKFAGREASAMGCASVCPVHVLLGLLLEGEGVAGLVLRKLNVKSDEARLEILKLLSPGDSDGPSPALAS